MMLPQSMSGQTVGILGLGVSGMAAARALAVMPLSTTAWLCTIATGGG